MRTFSSTVAPGRMLVIWYERARPLWEIRCGGSPATSSPFRKMRPLVGRSTPVTQLKKVLLPAPLGPMMARISPRGTVMLDVVDGGEAAEAHGRGRRCEELRPAAPRRPAATGAALREPARRSASMRTCTRAGTTVFSFGTISRSLYLHVPDLEDELAHEGLVVLLAERLVALGEVVDSLDLHALERLDQLHGVLAPAEARLLHAELEEVDRLEVRLHVAVGQRAARGRSA